MMHYLEEIDQKDLKNVINKNNTFIECVFSDLDFNGVNLTSKIFIKCSFAGSKFSGAIMDGTVFRLCTMTYCEFSETKLDGVFFDNCDLVLSEFIRSELVAIILEGSNLKGANFDGAVFDRPLFFGTNVDDALAIDVPYVCPMSGSFIAYKVLVGGYIAKLRIPEDAKRTSGSGRKCRCDKAEVLEIYDPSCHYRYERWCSIYDSNTVYITGKMVEADSFDECRWHTCAHGIHFFMTEKEALDYYRSHVIGYMVR